MTYPDNTLFTHFDGSLVQPGGVCSSIKTMALEGGKAPSWDVVMVGMFVCLCSASKKPSEREFFVPARTDLAVLLSTLSRRHSQKSFVVDVSLLVNLLVESTCRKSHTAHLRFLNQY
jgi:hypothetical protein